MKDACDSNIINTHSGELSINPIINSEHMDEVNPLLVKLGFNQDYLQMIYEGKVVLRLKEGKLLTFYNDKEVPLKDFLCKSNVIKEFSNNLITNEINFLYHEIKESDDNNTQILLVEDVQDIIKGLKKQKMIQDELENWEKNEAVIYDPQEETSMHLFDLKDKISTNEILKSDKEIDKFELDNKHYIHFISGGIAGAISRTITAPLERLKVLYQVNYLGKGIKPPRIWTGLKEIYINDGVKGLFRGNLINLLKSTPDSAIKLYVFEKAKFYLSKFSDKKKLGSFQLFLSGASAGVVSNLIIFPLDVVKTRLSASASGTYNGIFDTCWKLYKEGGIGIFYKGVQVAVCSTIPNTGLNLCCYESLKRAFSGSYSKDSALNLSTPTLMLIGGMSAMVSSTLMYPFQTIQARIIMKKSNENKVLAQFDIKPGLTSNTQQTMLGVIKNTIQYEGWGGFFKGYKPGITKIIMGNALGFSFYENIKRLIDY